MVSIFLLNSYFFHASSLILFISLSVFSYSSLIFFKRSFLHFFLVHRYRFSRVSNWSFINFLWWYHVALIIHEPYVLALVSAFEGVASFSLYKFA